MAIFALFMALETPVAVNVLVRVLPAIPAKVSPASVNVAETVAGDERGSAGWNSIAHPLGAAAAHDGPLEAGSGV
jgi:hypothetical protein